LIINKDNVLDLIKASNIKKPANEEAIALVNDLDEVQELLWQMDTDSIIYTFDQYLDVVDREAEIQRQLTTIFKGGIRW
jgi:hypothetical protein